MILPFHYLHPSSCFLPQRCLYFATASGTHSPSQLLLHSSGSRTVISPFDIPSRHASVTKEAELSPGWHIALWISLRGCLYCSSISGRYKTSTISKLGRPSVVNHQGKPYNRFPETVDSGYPHSTSYHSAKYERSNGELTEDLTTRTSTFMTFEGTTTTSEGSSRCLVVLLPIRYKLRTGVVHEMTTLESLLGESVIVPKLLFGNALNLWVVQKTPKIRISKRF